MKRAARGSSRAAAGVAVVAILGAVGSAAAQVDTHPRDLSMPSPSFARPDPAPHHVALRNGLIAYVVEDPRIPLVTITAFVRAGYAGATPAAAGRDLERALATAPAGLAPGTLADTLFEMAAEYRVSIGPELTEITLDVPAEDAVRGLALLARILRTPVDAAALPGADPPAAAAAPDEVAASTVYEGSLGSAVALFHENLFTDHPYGPPRGVASREQVLAFQRASFTPANLTLAIAGDFERGAMLTALRRAFDDWPRGALAPAVALPDFTPSGQRGLHLYPLDKLQGWVVLGHELPTVSLEHEAALEVMNYILGGGHFDTRLFRATRDRRGLTNDASGFLERRLRGPGSYTFQTYGRPEVVPLLVELMLREIDLIREQPVTAEEIATAKGALTDGEFAFGYRDAFATARSLAEEWARHGSHDRSASYVRRVRAVTAADVQAAARRFIHPERLQLVVVGPIDRMVAGGHPESTMPLDAFARR